MTVVVDASVALKWFVNEPGSDVALDLLTSGERLIAPDLVVAELCNAAWRLARTGGLHPRQVEVIAARAAYWFADLAPLPPLAPRAAALARDLGHPVYDCFYLALAEREGAPLVTADGRLIARLQGTPLAHLARPLASYGAPRP